MAYLALARRWRPRTFAEVVGQDHVVQALSGALRDDRVHHALLFSGTRGVGKTTIARALAKSLNCEQGPTPSPCGQCSSCVEIAEGRHVDLIEIDAASRTKVEDTRELLENVQYRPTRGRYKIYLIDEVHMLSRHSFNALLKTLEEPPPHVKFLLATTDPQKLPVTVLSRCLQFHLRSLTPLEISGHLARVLAGEGIACDAPALDELAAAARGSLRDALSLTDQAVAFGQGEVRSAQVTAMLGTARREGVAQLVRLLLAGDAEGVMAQVEQLAAQAVGFERLLTQLAEAMHRMAMIQFMGKAPGLLAEAPWPALASQVAPEVVQLYYRLFLEGRRELPLAPDPRIAVEMTLLRVLAFRPQGGIGRPAVAQPELDAPSALSDQLAAIEAEAEVLAGRPQPTQAAMPSPPPVPRPELRPEPAQPVAPIPASPAIPVSATPVATSPQSPLVTNSDTASVLRGLAALRGHQGGDEDGLKKPERPAPAALAINLSRPQPAPAAVSAPAPAVVSPSQPVTAARPAVRQDPAFSDEPPWDDDDLPPMDEVSEPDPGLWFGAEPAATEALAVTIAPVVAEPAVAASPTPPAPRPLAAADGQVEPRWFDWVGQLGVDGLTLQLALNSELLRTAKGWKLQVMAEQQHLLDSRRLDELAAALAPLLGEQPLLAASVGLPLTETPAQRRQRELAERRQQALVAMEGDATVQFFRSQGEAELQLDSLTLR
ncbi:MAG: DNA polymerase III subunit gamma/tau [Gammaproteobacteria bacterium]|nr:DNA polymerase III subunit gamma/tau [Gammaproteobacteria bacterium]